MVKVSTLVLRESSCSGSRSPSACPKQHFTASWKNYSQSLFPKAYTGISSYPAKPGLPNGFYILTPILISRLFVAHGAKWFFAAWRSIPSEKMPLSFFTSINVSVWFFCLHSLRILPGILITCCCHWHCKLCWLGIR